MNVGLGNLTHGARVSNKMRLSESKKSEGVISLSYMYWLIDNDNGLFLARLYKSTDSYCCHFDVAVSIGVGEGITLSKFFNVMVKALSGELSCMGTGLVLLLLAYLP